MLPRTKKWLLYAALAFAAIMLGTAVGAVGGALKSAPSLQDVEFNPQQTSYMYDVHGQVITRLYRENRVPVRLDQMPMDLRNAIVAIEDPRFYEHHGIDLRGILRALWVDLRSGRIVQGGSTITQQLARNAFLTLERTWSRKIKEVFWAIQIERKYTKDEILETYLNQIYLGEGAYGVEAASQLYFGKSVSKLDLAQCAMLAGLAQGPSYLSPYEHPDRALERRNTVLARMQELGYITPAQAAAAEKEPLGVIPLKPAKTRAPYFVDYVLQYLQSQGFSNEDLFAGGLRVYTTLDLKMQQAAEQALVSSLPDGYKDKDGIEQPQGALVAIDPRNGYIMAMVGGRGDSRFNRAVDALRQPGSAMKPFVYAAALDHGYTLGSIVDDSPVQFPTATGKPWVPSNYDHKYRGPITVRTALEQSVNVVAVKVLQSIGVDTAIGYAQKMGISTLVTSGRANDRNLSFALGGLTRGVSPLEMASAYTTFADQGIHVAPIPVIRVEDRNGNVLFQNRIQQNIVLNEQVAYLMTDALRGVIERGTGRNAQIGRPAAGKTGTTDDNTNAWFVGFTPDLVAAVWMGNDQQNKPLLYHGIAYGSAYTALIWGKFMSQALADTPPSDFVRPPNLVSEPIDTETGYLATTACPNVRQEIFIQGTEPTQPCPVHWWGTPLSQPAPLDATGAPADSTGGSTDTGTGTLFGTPPTGGTDSGAPAGVGPASPQGESGGATGQPPTAAPGLPDSRTGGTTGSGAALPGSGATNAAGSGGPPGGVLPSGTGNGSAGSTGAANGTGGRSPTGTPGSGQPASPSSPASAGPFGAAPPVLEAGRSAAAGSHRPPGGRSDLVEVQVCLASGELATLACPPDQVVTRWYEKDSGLEVTAKGTVRVPHRSLPTRYCTIHGM